MNLSTLFFVFAFLPVSLILYLLCPRVCKNALLILVSFLFYAWGSPVYLLLLLLVTVFNYCIGRDIGNRVESEQRGAKFVLVFGVLFNLLLLAMSEKMSFWIAYVVVSIMTIALISCFVMGLTKNKKAAILSTGILAVEYGLILVLVYMGSMALLIGSLSLFILIAVSMYFTLKLKVENEELVLK